MLRWETMSNELTAIVWDFDGTLVDTRAKNLSVTRALVELVQGRNADSFPALRSLADYEKALHRHSNWKHFYRIELEMTDEQVHDAGSRWMEHQLADRTAARLYDGIPEVLDTIGHVPHGIVSLNARDNILRFLAELELEEHFAEVIGYEEVGLDRQKPEPDALVLCIERLTAMRPGTVLFVGDHETDVQCAHNTTALFRERGLPVQVVSVSALYGPDHDDSGWRVEPDFRARQPAEILEVVERLPGATRPGSAG